MKAFCELQPLEQPQPTPAFADQVSLVHRHTCPLRCGPRCLCPQEQRPDQNVGNRSRLTPSRKLTALSAHHGLDVAHLCCYPI